MPRSRPTVRPVASVPVILLASAVLLGSPVHAQGDPAFLAPGSDRVTGCLEDSPCDCAALVDGAVEGTLRVGQLPPAPGVAIALEVTEVAWVVMASDGGESSVTGSFSVTASANAVETTILSSQADLLVDGVPVAFEVTAVDEAILSVGFAESPAFSFELTAPIDSCVSTRLRVFANLALPFLRGDVSGDGTVDLADPVLFLEELFAGVEGNITCADAADANDDGQLDIADAVRTLMGLFGGGAPPPDPNGGCGDDPSADTLSCNLSPFCP